MRCRNQLERSTSPHLPHHAPHVPPPRVGRGRQSEPLEVAESVTVEATDSAVAAPVEVAESGIDESELSPKELEILRLKQAEKFVVKETGVYECKVCGYGYEESEQGTAFTDLPNSWRCPQCLSQKGVFYAKTETIAGFAENQQYVTSPSHESNEPPLGHRPLPTTAPSRHHSTTPPLRLTTTTPPRLASPHRFANLPSPPARYVWHPTSNQVRLWYERDDR
mmetsp:Transcript_46188/g.128786  ORF Transcript_46188/g.128786 Transcript_46188/m.128786 type:complete len:222 (-) Transcript_46188:212-877(-)